MPDPRHGGEQVASSRKGAKSRTHGGKSRARVCNGLDSLVGLKKQLEERTRELAEAREQQTATSEVLRVISSSPGELEPVFQALLENAVRLCEANLARSIFTTEKCIEPVRCTIRPQHMRSCDGKNRCFAPVQQRPTVVLPQPSM
jgi:hypothetical protein